MGNTLYLLSHYTAGVILFGTRQQLAHQRLAKVQNVICENAINNRLSIVITWMQLPINKVDLILIFI